MLDLEMTESILLEDAGRAEALLASCGRSACGSRWMTSAPASRRCPTSKRLPIDLIKIDKSFIDDVPDDPRDCARWSRSC